MAASAHRCRTMAASAPRCAADDARRAHALGGAVAAHTLAVALEEQAHAEQIGRAHV